MGVQGSRGLRRVVVLCLVALVWVVVPAAGAADTTVGFESEGAPGDHVTTQDFVGDGVSFGNRAALGAPVLPSSVGCGGGPEITVVGPHSGVHAGLLRYCGSENSSVTGTLVKFDDPRLGASLFAGASVGGVRLIAYDASGHVLADQSFSTGGPGAKQLISISVSPFSSGMSWLSIQSATFRSNITIDDLSFPDGLLSVTGTPLVNGAPPFTGQAGHSVGGTLASFTDQDPSFAHPSTAYTATVCWGDEPDGAGCGAGGVTDQMTVTGFHSYADPGVYPVTVTVKELETGQTASGTTSVRVTDPPPSTVTGGASGVSDTSAVLDGHVDPKGEHTLYQFHYGTTSSYGSVVPAGANGLGAELGTTQPRDVAASISGLAPDTTYHYTLVATSDVGVGGDGVDKTFRTAPAAGGGGIVVGGSNGPPVASTDTVSQVTQTSARFNATVNPAGQDTSYVFQYGQTDFGAGTTSQSVGSDSADHHVVFDASGLSPNTTYQYRVVATNASGTTEGAAQSFTTGATPPAGAPVGKIGAVTDVTDTGATLFGGVDTMGQQTTVFCEYETDAQYRADGGQFVDGHYLSGGGTGVPVPGGSGESSTLCQFTGGLTADTIYHMRMHFDNGTVSRSGAVVFTTKPTPAVPTVVTLAPYAVDAGGAIVHGRIYTHGEDTAYHFEYWKTSDPGHVVNAPDPPVGIAGDNGSDEVQLPIAGLDSGTQYTVRISATNATGPANGATVDFTTSTPPDLKPTALTGAALPARYSAAIGGQTTPGGSSGSSAVYHFEYGTREFYGGSTPDTKVPTGSDPNVHASLTLLHSATTYHYRLVATNQHGTTYGNDHTFTTLPPPVAPTTHIVSVSQIRHDSALVTFDVATSDLDSARYRIKNVAHGVGAPQVANDGQVREGLSCSADTYEPPATQVASYSTAGSKTHRISVRIPLICGYADNAVHTEAIVSDPESPQRRLEGDSEVVHFHNPFHPCTPRVPALYGMHVDSLNTTRLIVHAQLYTGCADSGWKWQLHDITAAQNCHALSCDFTGNGATIKPNPNNPTRVANGEQITLKFYPPPIPGSAEPGWKRFQNHQFWLRVHGFNKQGKSVTQEVDFRWPAHTDHPDVHTGSAYQSRGNGPRDYSFSGTVNPRGENVRYQFEWGYSRGNLNHRTPARRIDGRHGDNWDDNPVGSPDVSFTPGKVVYYRLIAQFNDYPKTTVALGYIENFRVRSAQRYAGITIWSGEDRANWVRSSAVWPVVVTCPSSAVHKCTIFAWFTRPGQSDVLGTTNRRPDAQKDNQILADGQRRALGLYMYSGNWGHKTYHPQEGFWTEDGRVLLHVLSHDDRDKDHEVYQQKYVYLHDISAGALQG